MLSIFVSIVFASVVGIPSARAYLPNAEKPLCFDRSDEIQVDNEHVLRMKVEKPNAYKARAFVEGTVITDPYLRGEHIRFSIRIGRGATDTLEMIYNTNFGDLPRVQMGDEVVVCGEFINSFRDSQYPASPDGAIIHWLHHNPGDRDTVHEHGFMMFDNGLAGFDDAIPGAWDGEIQGARGGGSRRPQKGSTHRSGGRSYGERESGSERWRPCKSVEECHERNGNF